MTRSGRSVLYPARSGIASLTAVAALLAAGMSQSASADVAPSTAVPARGAVTHNDGGIPAGATPFSEGWTGPWAISFMPDGASALATERHTYRVFRLERDGSKTELGKVPHTVAGPNENGNGGLLGVAPSPTWNGTTDKRVFFVHTTESDTRVVRMSYDGTSLSDYTTVLGGIQRGGDHNGGKIAFGPDGYLYVTTGDGHQQELAQNKDSLNGKILRITKSGDPAPGNPFGNHVYSYGHRNAYGLAWDRNGRLWSAEIGEAKSDELNLIKPGANYGWPTCEGYCDAEGMTDPKKTWTPENGVPAQIAIVRNVIYLSSLRGQRLWRVPIDGESERVGTKTDFYANEYGRLRAIAKVPDADELWLGTSRNGAGKDQIFRVTIK